jgi:hypothetical protein
LKQGRLVLDKVQVNQIAQFDDAFPAEVVCFWTELVHYLMHEMEEAEFGVQVSTKNKFPKLFIVWASKTGSIEIYNKPK